MSDTQQNIMNDKCVVSTETTSDALQDSKLQNCEISKYSEKSAQNEENMQTENVTTIYTEMSNEDNTSERTLSVDLENQLPLATESSVGICGKKSAYIFALYTIVYIIAVIYRVYSRNYLQNNYRKILREDFLNRINNIWKKYLQKIQK